jgi:integrase
MATDRISFSDKTVATIAFAEKGQKVIRDADLPGFFVKVGTRTKSYMVQGDLWRGSVRQSITVKIGECGRLPAREARAKAKVLLGSIAEGIDPRGDGEVAPEPAAPISGPTLGDAWTAYRDSHMRRKNRSEGTIANYADHVDRLMAVWKDEPLSSLADDPSLVKARHDAISEENGPYIANGCMRSLRAIYNHARRTARSLPADNPTQAIDWNPEHRRDTAMGLTDLPAWFSQVAALENPMRREFHLFLLLSGSRPEAIKQAKREHLDLKRRLLHIPKPKGGADRAFDVPLSRQMVRTLIRAMRLGAMVYPEQSGIWVFPADSESGHLVEHKESRTVLAKWGNDLRQTYRTVGQAAGVNDVDMHLLMNHSLPGVNAGYITRNRLLGDHLRRQQQSISSAIFKALPPAAKQPGALKDWLITPTKAPERASRDDASKTEAAA